MNRRSARSALVAVLGAGMLLVVGGCSAAAPLPSPTPTPSFVSSYVPPPAYGIAPLTGEQIEVGALTAPSLAAKVDNHPDARPQVGLERTDIVFEELVEGGLTRYVAVWHSDVPDVIGPVRSIRPMDPDIISPLGGIVAYSGGQSRFVEMMRAAPVYNAIHGQRDTDATFYRGDNADAPHNVLVRAPEVIAQHLDLAAPVQQFAFAESVAAATATAEGSPTAGIAMRIGSGEARISTGGATVRATWSKRSMTAPIRLLDINGVAVRLAPGNTWVELVPLGGSLSYR